MTNLYNEDGVTIDLVDEFGPSKIRPPQKDWLKVPAVMVVEDTDGQNYAFRHRGCNCIQALKIVWPLFSGGSKKADSVGAKLVRVVTA